MSAWPLICSGDHCSDLIFFYDVYLHFLGHLARTGQTLLANLRGIICITSSVSAFYIEFAFFYGTGAQKFWEKTLKGLVVKTGRRAMIEPLNGVESPDGSVLLSVPIVPVLEDGAEETECLETKPCTIETAMDCGGREIPVTSTAKDCASAGGSVDDLKDLMGCD